MRGFFSLLVLFCISGCVNASSPPPTINPECPSMHHVAMALQKGVTTFTSKPTSCLVNKMCSGIICNDTQHGGKDFFLRMELKPCGAKPVLHLVLKYPGLKVAPVNIDQQFTSGEKQINRLFKIKIKLDRNRNKLHAKAGIYSCNPLFHTCDTLVFPILKDQTICLNMKNCKGYNVSNNLPCPSSSPSPSPTKMPTGKTTSSGASHVTGSTPVPLVVPTTLLPTSSVKTTALSTLASPKTSSPKPKVSTTIAPISISSTANPTTASPTRFPSGKTSHVSSTPENSGKTTVGPDGNNMAHKKRLGRHMSIGTAVGIGVACIAGIAVVIGAVFYYRRIRRSRLRAAYYNDISMNDPLYEDFGPEIA